MADKGGKDRLAARDDECGAESTPLSVVQQANNRLARMLEDAHADSVVPHDLNLDLPHRYSVILLVISVESF